MNTVDIQASVHNLTQMDRHQNEAHRTPVVHQDQNADRSQQEAAQRIDMPQEPDELEGKTADSENKARLFQLRRRRKKEEEHRRGRAEGRGFFIDCDA